MFSSCREKKMTVVPDANTSGSNRFCQPIQDKTPGDASYKHLFGVAVPMIIATSSVALKFLGDRLILAQVSPSAIAAVFPAGLTLFTTVCLFLGMLSYTGTFVAQYVGAQRNERVGIAIWQGLWLALITALLLSPLVFVTKDIFRMIGHDKLIQPQQVIYYGTLVCTLPFWFCNCVMSAFWIGRGKTRVVMFISILTAALNVFFDACFIVVIGLPYHATY